MDQAKREDENVNCYEKFRRGQAKREKDAKAAEYKSHESERRSYAARMAAQVRREKRDIDLIEGRATPRNEREDDLQFRALYGYVED